MWKQRRAVLVLGFVVAAFRFDGCEGFFISSHTETTLVSSATSATHGTLITLTATLAPTVATGTATFFDGTTSLGTGTLGSGTAIVSTLAMGTHTVTAEYSGDSTYRESVSSAVTITISTALTSTTTTLVATTSSAVYGSSVTLTASLSTTSATGTVIFYNGAGLSYRERRDGDCHLHDNGPPRGNRRPDCCVCGR